MNRWGISAGALALSVALAGLALAADKAPMGASKPQEADVRPVVQAFILNPGGAAWIDGSKFGYEVKVGHESAA
jgi:hypothetical protein